MRNDFLELLFPSRCFGCRVLGPKICTKCRQEWNPHLYIQTIDGLKIFSAIHYSATARSILLGAKEDSLKEADRYIQDALIHCLQRVPTISFRDLTLIPIPSARRSIRRRGRDFLLEISENLANKLGIQTISALEITRKTFDQTKLNAINRHENLLGAYRCSLSKDEIKNLQNVILVDDLVTTGATLIEAKRALTASGVHVTRAITACVAKPLR